MAKETTTLAAGQITPADAIVIELVAPEGLPQTVMIHWPVKATPVRPGTYADAASKAMRILAAASTELARLKAGRRL